MPVNELWVEDGRDTLFLLPLCLDKILTVLSPIGRHEERYSEQDSEEEENGRHVIVDQRSRRTEHPELILSPDL